MSEPKCMFGPWNPGGVSNRDRAIELRQAGRSLSQICDALGFKPGGGTLSRWLKGVPPPEWTLRPRAKDDLREQARALRREGKSYREIREVVPVSKSSLSLWLADIVLTHEQSWLELIGITRDRLIFRLHIHETADSAEALRFWANAIGVPEVLCASVSLKRHKPATNRRNVGNDYHGCLIIYVRRSTDLLRQIVGWWEGLADSLGTLGPPSGVV